MYVHTYVCVHILQCWCSILVPVVTMNFMVHVCVCVCAVVICVFHTLNVIHM